MQTVLVPGHVYVIDMPAAVTRGWFGFKTKEGPQYPVGTPALCLSCVSDYEAKGHSVFSILWPDGRISRPYMINKNISAIFIPVENFKHFVQ